MPQTEYLFPTLASIQPRMSLSKSLWNGLSNPSHPTPTWGQFSQQVPLSTSLVSQKIWNDMEMLLLRPTKAEKQFFLQISVPIQPNTGFRQVQQARLSKHPSGDAVAKVRREHWCDLARVPLWPRASGSLVQRKDHSVSKTDFIDLDWSLPEYSDESRISKVSSLSRQILTDAAGFCSRGNGVFRYPPRIVTSFTD